MSSEETEEVIQTSPIQSSSSEKTALEEAAVLYEKLMQGSVTTDHVCQHTTMMTIDDSLQRKKECLKSFRTAALWLQYMSMVDILHKHI